MQNFQQILEGFEKSANNVPQPCLFPGCGQPSIAPHSLQKNRFLKAVANPQGKVCMFKSESFGKIINKPDSPVHRATPVHINKATTFLGLCGDHDNSLFKAIENSAPDLDDRHHQFLLAYRTVLREQFVRAKGSRTIENAVAVGSKRGLITAELYAAFEAQINGHIAADLCFRSVVDKFHRFRTRPTLFKTWEWESIILVQRNVPPLVACESLFEIRKDNYKDIKYLIMCILPTEDGLTAIFYFRRAHRRIVHNFLREVLGPDFRNNLSLVKLSTLILCRSEIFCINFDHYQSFDREKKEIVQELFTDNMDMFEWNVGREVNLWTRDV